MLIIEIAAGIILAAILLSSPQFLLGIVALGILIYIGGVAAVTLPYIGDNLAIYLYEILALALPSVIFFAMRWVEENHFGVRSNDKTDRKSWHNKLKMISIFKELSYSLLIVSSWIICFSILTYLSLKISPLCTSLTSVGLGRHPTRCDFLTNGPCPIDKSNIPG